MTCLIPNGREGGRVFRPQALAVLNPLLAKNRVLLPRTVPPAMTTPGARDALKSIYLRRAFGWGRVFFRIIAHRFRRFYLPSRRNATQRNSKGAKGLGTQSGIRFDWSLELVRPLV